MDISTPAPTLTALGLLGQVAVEHLRNHLRHNKGTATLRFILDRLTAEQMAFVARAVLADEELHAAIEIRLPSGFLANFNLPPEVLTDSRATLHRNLATSKQAILLANTGDDEGQSLEHVTPVGAAQLLSLSELWVGLAAQGLPLDPAVELQWVRAFTGLREVNSHALERLAEYVVNTHEAILIQGLPFINALGYALPALRMPRDTEYFETLAEKLRGRASEWKKLYEKIERQRAPYLRRQTPSQTLLSESDLQASFTQVRNSIPEAVHPQIIAFIESDSGWYPTAAALAECEWDDIEPLFSRLRREKTNLGRETLSFYEDNNPEALSEDDREYLKRLIKRRTTQLPTEEDQAFHEKHRHEYQFEQRLKVLWDRFLHGAPLETEDFLAGLALRLERLFINENTTTRRLKIRLEGKMRRDLKELNPEAGRYFAMRYRSLPSVLNKDVEWEVGELFEFPKLIEEWAAKSKGKATRAPSTAKAALQLRFTLLLEAEGPTGAKFTNTTQLIWRFDPKKVYSGLVTDWESLTEYPLRFCDVTRETVSAKGVSQSVDLSNVQTFVPTHDQDRGSFVATYSPDTDVATIWPVNLRRRQEEGFLSEAAVAKLTKSWEVFSQRYSQAIREFFILGFRSELLISQAEAYGELLTQLCCEAKGGHSREQLVRPVLRLGSVTVLGGAPAEIITPWHPLRLLAMAVKVARAKRLLDHLLHVPELRLGDNAGRLFFKDLAEELAHPFYPEVALSWQDSNAELLGLSDTCADYTLHEPPRTGGQSLDETNENPTEGARRVVDLVERYLALQPHENANLSVVLYNCDSARLPQAVVDRLGARSEEADDARCQVLLRHRDSNKLRQLYERIVESSDTDPDAFNASEATRDFMARLRISISIDQASAPNSKDGPPNDIVFSQDVVSRHARLEWLYEDATPLPLLQLVPAQWSRRRPVPLDDTMSVVYLCCPVQTVEGWAYLTTITSFLRGDWDGKTQRRLLPARQLNFQETKMRQIFEETHNLGNWVVNYDELLDRRQLISQRVRVIRYKQSSTQGRNLVVSSNAPLDLLQSMVRNRIKKLELGLSSKDEQLLTEQFINDANHISGDLVLRAAKRGRSASELMGVVLSRFLIEREIQGLMGTNTHFGWYFLDDYADWLGQPEKQIADILMLNPSVGADGSLRLALVVSEAKYIDYSGLEAGAKNSRNQLRDTLRRMDDALFGVPARMDQQSWLARLSDLLLDGVQFSANDGVELAQWRRAVREGRCAISLRGYSHVFVSGPAEAPDCTSHMTVIPELDGQQEVYGFEKVRQLVLRYFRKDDPTFLRSQADGPVAPLTLLTFQLPQDGIIAQASAAPVTVAEVSDVIPASESLDKHRIGASTHSMALPASTDLGGENLPPSQTDNSKQAVAHSEAQEKKWAYPGITDLLVKPVSFVKESTANMAWLKSIEFAAKSALQGFGLQAKLEQSKLTPNAALLKFQGSAHLTVDQVLRRQTEFKTTYGLTLVSVQPEPGLIALAIARPQRQVVTLEELWARWTPDSQTGNNELVIAVREDDGELLTFSPQRHAPHTLIAGSTGSGKSVLMQNIILGIAATNTPAQAQILLIDPKQGVDYFSLESLPHLRGGIIDNQEKALEELEQLVTEMDNRYTRFKEARSSNLAAFNAKMPLEKQLPVIWLIHDEFAEWMLVEEYKKQVGSVVGRLGVKARAAGIYLVFAAQRPDANVMPMQLRANLGNRLILKVDSEGTSEIALGTKGAERLLGRGHLLAKLEGEPSMLFGQVPLIGEDVIEQIVSAVGGS